MMNVNDNEKKAIESEVKKRLGFSVPLDSINVTTEQVEDGIMSLLESERSKRKAPYKGIWVRAFLVEEKKMFSSKMELKLRLKTYWINPEGKLTMDKENRKLFSYTSMDLGGVISKIFLSMIKETTEADPISFKTPLDCSIYFQFKVEEGEPKLEVNFVKGENPNNIYQKVDFKTIFG